MVNCLFLAGIDFLLATPYDVYDDMEMEIPSKHDMQHYNTGWEGEHRVTSPTLGLKEACKRASGDLTLLQHGRADRDIIRGPWPYCTGLTTRLQGGSTLDYHCHCETGDHLIVWV